MQLTVRSSMTTNLRFAHWLAGRLISIVIMLVIAVSLIVISCADEPLKTQNQEKQNQEGKSSMQLVTGEFDVKIIPVETDSPIMGMMMLDKTYHGELKGTGKGRMLTGMTSIKNSAGYVAIEQIDGELNGKKGGFSDSTFRDHGQGEAIIDHHCGTRFWNWGTGWYRRNDGYSNRRPQAFL